MIWDKSHTRILAVTWKSRDSFEKFYQPQTQTVESQTHLTWVTTAPQIRNFGKAFLRRKPHTTRSETELRLKQYLGLSPQWQYDLFIEL